jgi:hypothetical protein
MAIVVADVWAFGNGGNGWGSSGKCLVKGKWGGVGEKVWKMEMDADEKAWEIEGEVLASSRWEELGRGI